MDYIVIYIDSRGCTSVYFTEPTPALQYMEALIPQEHLIVLPLAIRPNVHKWTY